jgi:hypothetical protein
MLHRSSGSGRERTQSIAQEERTQILGPGVEEPEPKPNRGNSPKGRIATIAPTTAEFERPSFTIVARRGKQKFEQRRRMSRTNSLPAGRKRKEECGNPSYPVYIYRRINWK